MNQPKSTRRDTQRAKTVWKFLCVKLTPEDEQTLKAGLEAARALGFATIRSRSAFVRHAIYQAARSNVETAQRLAGE